MKFRVGNGSDVHRLVCGGRFVLGGVKIPFDKSPVSHSDGDVLSHAICDALLGAAALGDIGRHFPDASPEYNNASSMYFLKEVRKILAKKGWVIGNVDSIVELERPKLFPYAARMQKKISSALGLKPSDVSVKAKSGEGIGEVGREEVIRAQAIALIYKVNT